MQLPREGAGTDRFGRNETGSMSGMTAGSEDFAAAAAVPASSFL